MIATVLTLPQEFIITSPVFKLFLLNFNTKVQRIFDKS